MGKRGFTLLEIIVVLIIIGIVATLGLTQYTAVVEKGRTAEAKANLGTLRTLATSLYQENGTYTVAIANYNLPTTAPACTNTSYYFGYSIDTGGTGTATRCTGGGKAPNASSTYSLTLTVAGVLTSPY